MFDQLSLGWQVWGYGLLGVIGFLLIVFVVAEWSRAWPGWQARRLTIRVSVPRWLRQWFTVAPCDQIDPPDVQELVRQDCDGFPLRTQALGQIMARGEVVDFAARRKQVDARAADDEPIVGYAFTFKP